MLLGLLWWRDQHTCAGGGPRHSLQQLAGTAIHELIEGSARAPSLLSPACVHTALQQVRDREALLAATQAKLDEAERTLSSLRADVGGSAEKLAEQGVILTQLTQKADSQGEELESLRGLLAEAERASKGAAGRLGPLEQRVAELQQQLGEAEALARSNTA
eukprot:SAG11_NODE_14511_length_609_cov_1.294118_1_plen_160_part_10